MVKYVLGCVYTDLPVGEMKNNERKRLSSFTRQNSAAWRLLVFCLVSSAIVEEKCRKEGNRDNFGRLFNVKLYLYQEKISLNSKGVGLGEESSNKDID